MTPLETWQSEIEAQSEGRLVLVRVQTIQPENVLTVPPEFVGRDIVRNLLLREEFVTQFIRAHAMNINYSGSEGQFHFVLLNMALAGDWQGLEDQLLAHEYGHIWLNVQGYSSPAYDNVCLSIHAGDIVQHVLIREETRNRGLDSMAFWIRLQQRWLSEQEATSQPPQLDGCQRLQLLSAWMDASLGLTEKKWDKLQRYLSLLETRFPQLKSAAASLQEDLARRDLWDRSNYYNALDRTASTLREVLW